MEHLICHHYKGETVDNYARIYILFIPLLLREGIGAQILQIIFPKWFPKWEATTEKQFFQMLAQYIVIRFYFNSSIEQYILFRYYTKKLNMNLNTSHDVLRYTCR